MSIASVTANTVSSIVYRAVSSVTGTFSYALQKIGLKKPNKEAERERTRELHRISNAATKPPPDTEDGRSWIEQAIGLEKTFYAGSPYAKVPLSQEDLKPIKEKHGARISEIKVETAPGRNLTAYQLNPQGGSSQQAYVVLSGIRSSAKFKLPLVEQLIQSRIPVILGNYTGVGSSYGLNISHSTIIKDAKVLIEKGLNEHRKLGIIGHSLGSAVSARVISQLSETRPGDLFGDMVMVSPWNKFTDVITTYPGPWLKPLAPILSLYSNRVLYSKETQTNVWDTGTNLTIAINNIAKYLEKHHVPESRKLRIHLFHGTEDPIVHVSQAEALEKRIQTELSKLPPRIRQHFEIKLHKIEGERHFSDYDSSSLPIKHILPIIKT